MSARRFGNIASGAAIAFAVLHLMKGEGASARPRNEVDARASGPAQAEHLMRVAAPVQAVPRPSAVVVPPSSIPGASSFPSPSPSPSVAVETVGIEDVRIGDGEPALAGQSIAVRYRSWIDGTGVPLDSNFEQEYPMEFNVGRGEMIHGWDQGIVGMKPGGIRRLTVPASLGYGDGIEGYIPAGATLIYEIELVEIRSAVRPTIR